MTKKVLLVGSSFSAAPIFFELKKRGFHISVCGRDKNDPCHQYADASYYFDYSIKENLLDLVKSNHFDYLVPSCNDYSYMSCVWIADQCGFPGYDSLKVADILHTKHLFRKFTGEFQLPAPKSIRHQKGQIVDVSGLSFPLLVKPVDSFSGRGVTKVYAVEDLVVATGVAEANSRSGEYVIEEFVEGGLHSHSAFIKDGRIAVDVFVDEFCTVYEYQVDCSNHPSRLSSELQGRVRSAMTELVEKLELNNGLLHTQFITNGVDFWIIECMRRCPGDLYGTLIDYSTGLGYNDLLIRSYIEEVLPDRIDISSLKYMGRHTISIDNELTNFTFKMDVQGKGVRVVPLKCSGERLGPAPYDKLAILFAEFDSRAQMEGVTPELAKMVSIQSLEGNSCEF